MENLAQQGTRGRRRGLVSLTILFACWSARADAETLSDVVLAVGTGSPLVARGQAQLEEARQSVRIARAAARPQLAGSANALQGTHGANAQAGFDRTLDSGLNLQFPIYSGGKVAGGIRAAHARAGAATAEFDRARSDAVADAIGAYLDVVRDREAVALTQANVSMLERILGASRDRFARGDATRTDVAQSLARLSLGRSRLETARGQLATSEDHYVQLIGSPAGALAPPPPLPAPPSDAAGIEHVALVRSPALAAADAGVAAAHADIATARADGRPTLSTTVSGEYHDYGDSSVGYPKQHGGGAQATAALSVPVYSGGLVRAEVRRARAAEMEADGSREIARRQAVADARRAISDYRAYVAMIALGEEAMSASQSALTGTEADNRGGDRTILDVLNATLQLLDAQMALLDTRHDAYAAGVAVLKAVDRLDCLASPAAAGCTAAMAGS